MENAFIRMLSLDCALKRCAIPIVHQIVPVSAQEGSRRSAACMRKLHIGKCHDAVVYHAYPDWEMLKHVVEVHTHPLKYVGGNSCRASNIRKKMS
jgi:hypothetical protein